MTRALTILALLALAATAMPTATAEGVDAETDLRVVIAPDGSASHHADNDALAVRDAEHTPGERYAWTIRLAEPYTIVEVQVAPGAFDVERARQIVPTLVVPHEEYPLFTPVPWDIAEAEAVPRYGLHNATTSPDGGITIRLGLPGPREGGPAEPFDARLALARDVTPPTVTQGPIRDLTHVNFYQEATTDELALVDLVVCCDPEHGDIRNPTTVYHFLHKFPIQGLDAETTYELRMEAIDWAGNERVTPTYNVTTPAEPVVPTPTVEIVSPTPNARVEDGVVVIEARIVSPDAPIEDGGSIRLFVDKKEVRENLEYVNGTFRWTPREPLAPGLHSVGLEVMNGAGGFAREAWTFEVEGARTPGPAPWLAVLAAVALFALVRPRRDA